MFSVQESLSMRLSFDIVRGATPLVIYFAAIPGEFLPEREADAAMRVPLLKGARADSGTILE